MDNINSFAGNMTQLSESVNDVLKIVEGMNEAMIGNQEEVKVTDELTLPSFSNITKRVERAESTISKFVQGKGVIETDDGTYRKVKVTTISRPPETIETLDEITSFSINPNWFFESLQYPRCVVKIDLTGKIPDNADRVYVNRIILDSTGVTSSGEDNSLIFESSIKGQSIGYANLISLFEQNGVSYKEDRDEVSLPLTYEKYKGEFGVSDIRLLKDENGKSQQWIFLDNIDYNQVDEDGVEVSAGNHLNIGDYLRFNNSLYKISGIDQTQRRVKVDYAVGYETIGVGDILEFYNEPFSSKVIEVGIGINEYNIIYVKAVNEEYNLLSKDWSVPIAFFTNDLVLENTSDTTLSKYHSTSVADFGQKMIAQIKEGQIYAVNGLVPNSPVLNANDLSVVQINTQLDATLDKETYNNLTAEIASAKSNISAVRTTISNNKDMLIQASSEEERNSIQTAITADTTKLNSLTTQYNSLVNELNTLLNESGAINYTPKYHIRGFFNIPESRYTDEDNMNGEQVIVGFEILYRYLHTDETGVTLNTFEYTGDNETIQTGVFTDWNLSMSKVLSKTYNYETGLYEWSNENTADGTTININQIDIPIRSGEKVEIKVRSLSEAGYPYNPLKSEWSNSVIISFPENLTSDDNVSTLLDTVKSDLNAVVLQETMSAAGLYSHLSDSNSTYKHAAKTISYTETYDASNNKVTYEDISLQEKISSLSTETNKKLNAIIDSEDLTNKIKNVIDSAINDLKILSENDISNLINSKLSELLVDYITQTYMQTLSSSIDSRISDLSSRIQSLETRISAATAASNN